MDSETETLIPMPQGGFFDGAAHTLRAGGFDASEDGTGRGTPLVPMSFDTTQITSPDNRCQPSQGAPCHPLAARAHPPAIAFSCKDYVAETAEIAPTLRAMPHDGSHANGGGQVAVVEPFTLAIRGRGDSHHLEFRQDGVANALLTPNGGRAGKGVGAIAFANSAGDTALGMSKPGVPPITCRHGDPGNVCDGLAVRRLTPRECERLQGFPDDYTRIPWRTYQEAAAKGVSYESLLAQRGQKLREPAGEECPDGPRYRALGNSMAVPVMAWIGRRIALVDDIIGEKA